MRILLSVLLLLGSVSIAKADQLFGITLHENILNYANNYDVKNAARHIEADDPFREIQVIPPITNSQFSEYWLGFDAMRNSIEEIATFSKMPDLNTCIKYMNSWLPRLERRFSVNLDYGEFVSGDMLSYSHDGTLRDRSQVTVRCNVAGADGVSLYLGWRSDYLTRAVNDYYDNLEKF
jgi:hypothetical protein